MFHLLNPLQRVGSVALCNNHPYPLLGYLTPPDVQVLGQIYYTPCALYNRKTQVDDTGNPVPILDIENFKG